ncbi:hypothetical protein TWF281_001431 [Arthrobotrys megalospora]
MASVDVRMYPIDQQGDVLAFCTLDGEEQILGALKISFKAISLASQSFRIMFGIMKFFPKPRDWNFAEDIEDINLTVESLDSALLVMNVIHLRGSQNPKQITLQRLYEVALFCDRYNCGEAISSAAELWTKPLWSQRQKQKSKDQDPNDNAKWLSIGKVFKRQNILESLARDAVFEIVRIEDGFQIRGTPLNISANTFAEGLWDERERLLGLITEFMEDKLTAIEAEYERSFNNNEVLQTTRCRMTSIGIIHTLKLQLGYPTQSLDRFTLSAICKLLRETCEYGERIEECSNLKCCDDAFCKVSKDLDEAILAVELEDEYQNVILKAAGIKLDAAEPGPSSNLSDTFASMTILSFQPDETTSSGNITPIPVQDAVITTKAKATTK